MPFAKALVVFVKLIQLLPIVLSLVERIVDSFIIILRYRLVFVFLAIASSIIFVRMHFEAALLGIRLIVYTIIPV